MFTQNPDMMGKNRGQILIQYRKLLWKSYISFHEQIGHILLTSVIEEREKICLGPDSNRRHHFT